MKVTLILVLVAVVGLSSAYSLGDVYEKLHRVERDMSSGMSGSTSVERIEKRDISTGSNSNSVSLERIEKRDIAASHDLDLRRLRQASSSESESSEESSEEWTTAAP
ncbi:uncharacterized protein [Penaeus vannamei]|uniref:uncharacterized protein isoform X2 n=1 Tax=Penaeus vannamei TaxID=6689 RepID=UPI00387F96E3